MPQVHPFPPKKRKGTGHGQCFYCEKLVPYDRMEYNEGFLCCAPCYQQYEIPTENLLDFTEEELEIIRPEVPHIIERTLKSFDNLDLSETAKGEFNRAFLRQFVTSNFTFKTKYLKT